MDAKRAGLSALVEAYKLRVSGAPSPSDDVLLRHVLQQLGNPAGAASLATSLDDVPGSVQLKPSELIGLLQKALEVDSLMQRLKASEAEADEAWNGIYEARRIVQDSRLGTPAQRYSQALKRLGMVRKPHGEGRKNPKYEAAADHYRLLRGGGHDFVNGVLTRFEKLDHDDAVKAVCEKFCLEWETLTREWADNGIKVSFDAPAYGDPAWPSL